MHEQYAIAVEQRLIQNYTLVHLDKRVDNKSFCVGSISEDKFVAAGVVYFAYMLEADTRKSTDDVDGKFKGLKIKGEEKGAGAGAGDEVENNQEEEKGTTAGIGASTEVGDKNKLEKDATAGAGVEDKNEQGREKDATAASAEVEDENKQEEEKDATAAGAEIEDKNKQGREKDAPAGAEVEDMAMGLNPSCEISQFHQYE